MELALDPAALGGLAGVIALSGWAFGRMQKGRMEAGGMMPTAPTPATASHIAPTTPTGGGERAAGGDGLRGGIASAPSPCQQRAIAERRAIFALPVALGELHDQVSAIRRDERVFDQAPAAQDLTVLFARGSAGACRYLGRSGQPTCPGSVKGTCQDGGACTVSGRFPANRPWPNSAPAKQSALSRQA